MQPIVWAWLVGAVLYYLSGSLFVSALIWLQVCAVGKLVAFECGDD